MAEEKRKKFEEIRDREQKEAQRRAEEKAQELKRIQVEVVS